MVIIIHQIKYLYTGECSCNLGAMTTPANSPSMTEAQAATLAKRRCLLGSSCWLWCTRGSSFFLSMPIMMRRMTLRMTAMDTRTMKETFTAWMKPWKRENFKRNQLNAKLYCSLFIPSSSIGSVPMRRWTSIGLCPVAMRVVLTDAANKKMPLKIKPRMELSLIDSPNIWKEIKNLFQLDLLDRIVSFLPGPSDSSRVDIW